MCNQGPQGPPGGLGNPGSIGQKVSFEDLNLLQRCQLHN